MNVMLEIGGSEVMLTGALIKCIIELKNNYFGLYDSVSPLTRFNLIGPLNVRVPDDRCYSSGDGRHDALDL